MGVLSYYVPIKKGVDGLPTPDVEQARNRGATYSLRALLTACAAFGAASMFHNMGFETACAISACIGVPFGVLFGGFARMLTSPS